MRNKGVTMISMVITIVIIIILASVALSYSGDMIDDSIVAVDEADIMADNDEIRALLTYAVIDKDARQGIALVDGTMVVIGSGDVSYGTGYHLIVGGSDEDIDAIEEKMDGMRLAPYKNLTAPYVVNYDMGTFERIDEIKFR